MFHCPREFARHCYWLFKWNYQGLLLNIRYRALSNLLETERLHEDSPSVEEAHENFEAAQFACKYGRVGDKAFRQLVKDLETHNILSREQLRLLIEGGILKKNKNSNIVVKPPIVTTLCGAVALPMCLFSIFAFSFLITLAPISLVIKIVLLLLFNAVFFSCTFVFNYYSLVPYRTIRKERTKVESYIEQWFRRTSPDLMVIK